jgi:hypothetical protein
VQKNPLIINRINLDLASLSDNSRRSEIIRQAFLESIAVLGERTCKALIEDLQRYRVFLYDDENLSLEPLATGLRELVGKEVSELLLERVIIKLEEYSLQSIEKNKKEPG